MLDLRDNFPQALTRITKEFNFELIGGLQLTWKNIPRERLHGILEETCWL